MLLSAMRALGDKLWHVYHALTCAIPADLHNQNTRTLIVLMKRTSFPVCLGQRLQQTRCATERSYSLEQKKRLLKRLRQFLTAAETPQAGETLLSPNQQQALVQQCSSAKAG
jgi:hypothetical protein